MSRGQKLARSEKEYIPSDWTSDTKILMTGDAEGDFSVCKGILKYSNFGLSYNMLKMLHNRSLRPRSNHDKLDDEM